MSVERRMAVVLVVGKASCRSLGEGLLVEGSRLMDNKGEGGRSEVVGGTD